MADIVGLKETEYTDLESGIKRAHDDYISKMETALKQIQRLNTKAGGFYLVQVSPNVDSTIAEINKLKNSLQKTFTAHEQIIKTFQSAIDNYDTIL